MTDGLSSNDTMEIISDIRKDLIRMLGDLIKVMKDMRKDLRVDLRSLIEDYAPKLWKEEEEEQQQIQESNLIFKFLPMYHRFRCEKSCFYFTRRLFHNNAN